MLGLTVYIILLEILYHPLYHLHKIMLDSYARFFNINYQIIFQNIILYSIMKPSFYNLHC
jgi:hypothetical protein